tara:strand:+ start:1011 stop:1235 length:225 start_codon:yes stop_codon:yes gene_type:complete
MLIAILTSSCTEFAMLSSTTGIAVSNNIYAKAYSGVDFLTIINTEKDIKTHIYNSLVGDYNENGALPHHHSKPW